VQLVQVTDGYHIWSQKYDAEVTDLFQIQDEISRSILQEVKDELLGGILHEVTRRMERDPEAHELYLKGMYYLNKYNKTENFLKAIDFFEQALEIEPDYMECLSEMASCYIQLWFFSQVDAKESVDKAKLLIARAYEFAPQDPALMAREAHLRTWYNYDLKGARDLFLRSLKINPHNSEALMHLGVVWTYLQKYDLAEEAILKGISLDPLSPILQFTLAFSKWYEGEFEKAIEILEKLILFKPRFWGGHYLKGVNLLEVYKPEEALEYGKKSVELFPSSMTYALLAQSHLLCAHFDEAKETVKVMEEQIDKFPVSNFDLGHLNLCLGEFEKSRDYFQKALDANEGRMLFLLPSCRKLKKIHKHPYFEPFFEHMKAISES
jgi:tetratricopeptide (TPR) repeat protein